MNEGVHSQAFLELKLAAYPSSLVNRPFSARTKLEGLVAGTCSSDNQVSRWPCVINISSIAMHLLAGASCCACPCGWLAPCQIARRLQQRSDHLQAAAMTCGMSGPAISLRPM